MSRKYLNTISNFKQAKKVPMKENDSIVSLKNKITFETLKENLNSPMFSSASLDFKYKETICETEKNSTLKSTLRKIKELKKHNQELSRDLISKKEGLTRREKLRTDLENEYLFHNNEFKSLKENVEATSKILEVSRVNHDKISNYCKRLKEKYRDLVVTIEKYEGDIDEIKKEKKDLTEMYEDTLRSLNIESDKIIEQNVKLKEKIEKDESKLREQTVNFKDIEEQYIKERIEFQSKQEQNKNKILDFTSKMKKLEKKIYEYKYMTVYKENQDEMELKRENKEKEEIDKLKMTLLDIEHHNQFLISKLTDAENQNTQINYIQNTLSQKDKNRKKR